jgi:HSP20 family protein
MSPFDFRRNPSPEAGFMAAKISFRQKIFQFHRHFFQLAIVAQSLWEGDKKGGYMSNIMRRNHGNGGTMNTTSPGMTFGGLVDNIFQNTLNRFFDDDLWSPQGSSLATGRVPVNIRETDKSYEMEVVAPGLRKEDFNVNISDNMLTVSFEHKQENNEENKQNGYLRKEYRMQSFSRSFNLDDTIDAEKISAQYNDGVLRLSLPKKEGAQRLTKNIQVR